MKCSPAAPSEHICWNGNTASQFGQVSTLGTGFVLKEIKCESVWPLLLVDAHVCLMKIVPKTGNRS